MPINVFKTPIDKGLQLENGALASASLQNVTDSANTVLGLKLSTVGLIYPTIVQPYTVTAGAVNMNCNLGDIFTTTLVNGTPTNITLSNARKGSYIIQLKQPAAGSATVVWVTSIVWSGGSAPTLTTTANYLDIITLVYDGTTWRGTATLNFSS